jgi:hypothetical protein
MATDFDEKISTYIDQLTDAGRRIDLLFTFQCDSCKRTLKSLFFIDFRIRNFDTTNERDYNKNCHNCNNSKGKSVEFESDDEDDDDESGDNDDDDEESDYSEGYTPDPNEENESESSDKEDSDSESELIIQKPKKRHRRHPLR